MIQLHPDFKEFLRLLNSKSVNFILIGGYAVNFYGYLRTTDDLDIWIRMDELNSERVKSALINFGFDKKKIEPLSFNKPNQIFRMGFPPIRIEIMTTISGIEFDECIEKCVLEEVDGIEIKIISLDKLKTNKKASGRFKDMDDLENLDA